LNFNGHVDRRKKIELKLCCTVPSSLGRGGEVGVCHLLVANRRELQQQEQMLASGREKKSTAAVTLAV